MVEPVLGRRVRWPWTRRVRWRWVVAAAADQSCCTSSRPSIPGAVLLALAGTAFVIHALRRATRGDERR